MFESDDKLVRIIPVQIDKHHKDPTDYERIMVRRWMPYCRRYFNKGLTPEKLVEALIASNAEPKKFTVEQHSDLILYQYRNKPPIILNTRNCHFYSTVRHIEKYGIEAVQYQAYIIIEIMNKNELSAAKRGHAKFLDSETELEKFKTEVGWEGLK